MANASPRAGTALSLTDDIALEGVLADIPFFCVGLTAMAFGTYFLFTKRITFLALYLYISSLLAFSASIFDISQILAGDKQTGLDSVREVGFALSVGFRFLFLWTFVAERPHGEPPLPERNAEFNPRLDSHSASWRRWGYLGLFLQWSLLVLSATIPILQIVWRIAARRPGTVYMIESTLEIVASGLFILKIFLNIFLSPFPWWRPLLSYSVPITVLLLNLGVGIGSMVMFAFSETILGRFFQAVELYLLILYILITAFYKIVPRSQPVRFRRDFVTSSFGGLEKAQAPFQMALPGTSNGVTMIDGLRDPPNLKRRSNGSRLSSWLLPPGTFRIRASDDRRTWDAEDNGRVSPQDLQQDLTIAETVNNLSPRVQTLQEAPRPPAAFDKALLQPPTTSVSGNDARMGTPGDSDSDKRPTTGVSFSSYYGMQHNSRVSFSNPSYPMGGDSRVGSDSPVYGLNGIMGGKRISKDSTARARTSMSSFDELLRQQTELDKSIAALRLFSPEGSAFPSQANTRSPTPNEGPSANAPTAPPLPPDKPTSRIRSASTNSVSIQRVESASARSEFSLSIFPEPPTGDVNSLLPAAVGTGQVFRPRRQSRGLLSSGLPSSRVFSEDVPSSPNEHLDSSTPRLGSAATQYEITSFIGDLTTPIDAPRPKSFLKDAKILSDVESEDESPTIITANSAQTLRPMVVGATVGSATSLPSLGPASASSGILSAANSSDSGQTVKAFKMPTQNTPAVSSPLAVYGTPRNVLVAPAGPRRPVRGPPTSNPPPSRPKLNISNPRPPLPDGRSDQAPGAFERPRPPPLLLPQSGDKDGG